MCLMISNLSCLNRFLGSVETASSSVVAGYTWLGKKIELLTDAKLPGTPAKIVQMLFWTLPHTAAIMLVPSPYFYVAFSLLLLPEETLRQDFGNETMQQFYTGLRNATIIKTTQSALSLISRGDLWSLASLLTNIYLSMSAHLAANPELAKA
jgi:hypothetical protein